MSRERPGRRWTVLAGGVLIAVAGALVAIAGLENADRVASVVGAAAGLLGLVIAVQGGHRARTVRPAENGRSVVAHGVDYGMTLPNVQGSASSSGANSLAIGAIGTVEGGLSVGAPPDPPVPGRG